MWRNIVFFFSFYTVLCLSAFAQQDSPRIDFGYGYKEFVGRPYDGVNNVRTHLFFLNEHYLSGQVMYRGRLYYADSLKYDLYRDLLVTLYTDDLSPIFLMPDQVSEFTLSGHRFIHLPKRPGISDGYYELLFDSPDQKLYARHAKSLLKGEFVNGAIYDLMTSTDHYYFLVGGKYHPISKVKDLQQFLSVDKAEMKAFYAMHHDGPALQLGDLCVELLTYLEKKK